MPHRMKERTRKNDTLRKRLKYDIPTVRLALIVEGTKTAYPVYTPECIERFLEPLKLSPNEQFISLLLNAKHEIIGLHVVSEGTISSSLVHPREVFKSALLANAYAIVVAHNHPSGSELAPSPEDLETTEQLVKAGAILGVSVMDHVIISPTQSHYSLRERHPDLWKK